MVFKEMVFKEVVFKKVLFKESSLPQYLGASSLKKLLESILPHGK
ncbi:MAG: hypothetical protein ACI9WS_000763 [Paraglaciecola psychrophila]|jgi:hypothetical protein